MLFAEMACIWPFIQSKLSWSTEAAIKISSIGWLKQKKNAHFSQPWLLRNQQIQCLVKAHFMVHKWKPSHCLSIAEGKEGSLGSLIRPLIRFMKVQSNCLSKSPGF